MTVPKHTGIVMIAAELQNKPQNGALTETPGILAHLLFQLVLLRALCSSKTLTEMAPFLVTLQILPL